MDALDLTAEQQPQLEDQLVSFTTISKLSNGSNSCDPVFILPYSRLCGHQEKSETLEGSGRRSKDGILDHSDGALLCGVYPEAMWRCGHDGGDGNDSDSRLSVFLRLAYEVFDLSAAGEAHRIRWRCQRRTPSC